MVRRIHKECAWERQLQGYFQILSLYSKKIKWKCFIFSDPGHKPCSTLSLQRLSLGWEASHFLGGTRHGAAKEPASLQFENQSAETWAGLSWNRASSGIDFNYSLPLVLSWNYWNAIFLG